MKQAERQMLLSLGKIYGQHRVDRHKSNYKLNTEELYQKRKSLNSKFYIIVTSLITTLAITMHYPIAYIFLPIHMYYVGISLKQYLYLRKWEVDAAGKPILYKWRAIRSTLIKDRALYMDGISVLFKYGEERTTFLHKNKNAEFHLTNRIFHILYTYLEEEGYDPPSQEVFFLERSNHLSQ